MWGKSWLGKSVKERRPVETNQFRLNRTGVLLVGNLIFSIRIVHKAKFNPFLSLEYLSFSLSEGSDLAVRCTRSQYQDHRGIFFGTSLAKSGIAGWLITEVSFIPVLPYLDIGFLLSPLADVISN